jgi:hypothetical protein
MGKMNKEEDSSRDLDKSDHFWGFSEDDLKELAAIIRARKEKLEKEEHKNEKS